MLLGGALAGCTGNTVLNYTPATTDPSLAQVTSTYKAMIVANLAASMYDQWAQNVANVPQLFEIPIIGTAIAAVAELAYSHPHVGPALSLGIAGGSLAALNSYYNPRARVSVYYDSAEAMRCTARVAAPLISDEHVIMITLADGSSAQVVTDTPYTFDDGHGGKVTLAQVVASAATDAQTKAALQPLVILEQDKASLLADGMDQVNARAIARGLNASAAPNVSTISSNLKTSLQSSQNLQVNANASKNNLPAAVARAGTPGPSGLSTATPTPTTQNPLDDPRVKALITFQSDLTACIAKAG